MKLMTLDQETIQNPSNGVDGIPHFCFSSVDSSCKLPEYVKYPDANYNVDFKLDWIENDFSRRVISEVEGIELNYDSVMKSLKANFRGYRDISTGSKNLILTYNTNCISELARMGPNCYKFLFEIAKKRYLRCQVACIPIMTDEIMRGRPIHIINDNSIVTTAIEFSSVVSKALSEGWYDE